MRRLYLFLILVMAGRCLAQSDDTMGFLLSPKLGQQKISANYAVDHHFQEDAGPGDREMGFTKHGMSFRLPLSQDETREWTVGGGVGVLDFDTNAIFPDSSCLWRADRFPGELWDLRLDTTYRWRMENGWIAGGQLAVNSPSDRPFASLEEMAVMFNAFARIPQGESDAWVLFLNYSSNREFLQHIPIPGAGYQLKRERLSALLGLPLSNVHVEPLDWLHLDASYFIPRTIHGQVSVLPIETVRFYAGYHWTNNRFLRHDRADDDDRLFYYEQNVKGGVEWKITEWMSVDVHGGYAFNRLFFEGEEYDDRDQNRIDMDDGPFLGAQIAVRF
ncbi:MAG: hypothetical protein JXA69_00580 [Phycisphaerae bacterium]|nr:hypothetical protein [Phycisphaerae bacterium]